MEELREHFKRKFNLSDEDYNAMVEEKRKTSKTVFLEAENAHLKEQQAQINADLTAFIDHYFNNGGM